VADAARQGDPTNHPGMLQGALVPTVRIGGQPAAVLGTPHVCSFPGNPPHPPTTILAPPSRKVRIGGRPAAVVGDSAGCGARIAAGAPTVHIGG
jgi:uncharacterized Zn-binding protein involved in type VI secretion